jgi:carboxypeptidase Q
MVPVRTRTRTRGLLLAALLTAAPAMAQVAAPPTETVDYDAIYRIKDEGFQRSQVMETASWLTDVHGPRLTGSPSFKAAADWTVRKLTEWGAANARIESWGTFGRGWVNERFSATVVSGAQPWIITGVPKAWTPGRETVTADAVFAPMENEADLEKWKGKLAGKIVLPVPSREVKALFDAPATRMSEAELEKLSAFEPGAAARRNYNQAAARFGVKRL